MMTRQVNVGGVLIGGGAPVSIQSMTNTPTANVEATVNQCNRLLEAGCEIIRITVNDQQAAEGFREIRRRIDAPLVADIHFDYTMALAAIKAGADKIRINPGNIGDVDRVRKVVTAAKEARIPIRVGVNSGSLEKDILERYGKVTAEGLAESGLRNAELVESLGFEDIVLSIKSSDVKMNTEAYRIAAERSDYPLHIGVTEAGTKKMGIVKSAAGIGALLLSGIGDTMRVSLTADPVEEIYAAKDILSAVGIRKNGIDITSCPTCGRTKVDLERIVEAVERRLSGVDKNVHIAVMGCAVNGPGEAREADFGVACGDGEGLIFSKGEILKKVKDIDIAEEIGRLVENYEEV